MEKRKDLDELAIYHNEEYYCNTINEKYYDEKVENDMIYRFRYFYTDGTSELSNCKSKDPFSLYNDFDGLIDWDLYNSLDENEVTLHQILELAIIAYKNIKKDFYRIEIVNTKTNEVLDYIDKRK